MSKHQQKIEVGPLYREYDCRALDEEGRTVDLTFSSEDPYERFFGMEVLDHSRDSVRLDRLRSAGVGLFNHDRDVVIGTLSDVDLKDGKGTARLQFFDDEDGNRIFGKVKGGLRNVSVGYRVHAMKLEESKDDGPDTYRVTDWEPFEVSIVSVPADATVGVGRGKDAKLNTVTITGVRSMTEEVKKVEQKPEIDIKAEQAKAVNEDRERQRVIRDLAGKDKFKGVEDIRSLAEKCINEGTSADAFARQALEIVGVKTFEPKEVTSDDVGLTKKQKKQFSMSRLIRGLTVQVNPNYVDQLTRKQWEKEAGFEFEVCHAFAKVRGNDPREECAAAVPTDLMYGERILTVGTEGTDIVDEDIRVGDFAEILRNKSVVVRAGSRLLPGLRANVQIPTQTGKGAITWVAESGSAADTTQTFGQKTLTPHTMAARTDISRRLMLQSVLVMDEFVRGDLTMGMTVELDRVAIEGAPAVTATANEPEGIINTSGIGSVALGTHGAAPTRDSLVDLVTEIAQDNALMGTPTFLMNAQTVGFFQKLKVDTGSGQFVMDRRNEVIGFPVLESQNIPADLTKGSGTSLHAVILGDFTEQVIGLWSGQDVLVDPYTQGATGALRIIVFQDVDCVLRRPVSFAAIVDAVIS